MQWTITIEGIDEFGATHRSEITLEKDLNTLTAGALGFSIENGKSVMAHLQQVIVKQQCETYVPEPANLELPALLTVFL
jgi:hypothetical protein